MKSVALDSRPEPPESRTATQRATWRLADAAGAWAKRHPVAFVALAAAAARLAFALVSFVIHPVSLVPDEVQYIGVASYVARGEPADLWLPGYGQLLYNYTWVFTAPLRVLFEIFGPSRLVGQLWAAAFGVACAALTTRLALMAVRRWLALAGGLVVALLPSQLLWSSVVLRESLIWAALALVGLCVALGAKSTGWRRWAALGGCGGALAALAFLRPQTMLAAAWVLPAAVFLAGGHARVLRSVGALALAVVIPAGVGLGPAGWTLVQKAVPSLAATRTNFAVDAESAFTPTTLVSGPSTTLPEQESVPEFDFPGWGDPSGFAAPPGAEVDGENRPGPPSPGRPNLSPQRPNSRPRPPAYESGAQEPAGEASTGPATSEPNGVGPGVPTFIPEGPVVRASDGSRYYADGSFGANISHGVGGFLATAFRPWPWETADSVALQLSRLENLVWYALYVLAVCGLILGYRRRAVAAFPVLLTGAILGIAALTQGNLGTAFRHRGQILWCVALLAAMGAELLLTRRASKRSGRSGNPVDVETYR